MKETIDNINEVVKKDLADLAQKRDELKLQVNLGTKEAKAEWEKLNEQYKELEQKVSVESQKVKKELEEKTEVIRSKATEVSAKAEQLKEKASEDLNQFAAMLKKDFESLKNKLKS